MKKQGYKSMGKMQSAPMPKTAAPAPSPSPKGKPKAPSALSKKHASKKLPPKTAAPNKPKGKTYLV